MKYSAIIVAALLAWQPLKVAAQVAPTQTGQALDANYQIGSGGYNTVVGGEGGVNAQLIVNRQVTGLGGFRGPIVTPSNELRLVLPTSSLNDFNRQSVGVPQVRVGSTYQVRPYYSAERTVFGVGGITSGLTPPGTSAAYGTSSVATIQRAWTEVVASYSQTTGPLTRAPVVTEAPAAAPIPQAVVSQPGAVALFGITTLAQREQLARELIQQRELLQRLQPQTSQEPGFEPNEAAPGTEQNLPPSPQETALKEIQVGGHKTLGQPDQQELSAGTRGGRVGAPPANQDIFVDVLMGLQRQRRGPQAPAVSDEQVPQGQQPERPNLVEVHGGQVILHSLAGKSADAFNTYMTQAQNLLKRGQYYEAAQQYESASIVSPTNPMAKLGSSVALFSAGEPYSSALFLKWALEAFPPLMETRLDLASMLKIEDFDKRLKDLDQRIKAAKQADPMLLLAASFMHLNRAGKTPVQRQENQDKARDYARALQNSELAQSDNLVKLYCEYVLTGKLPATRPAPATMPAR